MKDLKNVFLEHGFSLNETQICQFEKFFEILIEKNKVMNLTAITEEREVLFKHFLDSCLPEKFFPKNASVVDVGSGAGFPSIPLKILRPDLQITMLDSLQKRVNFLNEVTLALNLENICAFHSRAEDFAKQNREKFDVVTARAVAPLCTLCELLLPLSKVGGRAIVFKSTKLAEELDLAKKAISVLGAEVNKIESFELKEINAIRNVLILNKTKSTPKQYPRGKNLPKQKPII